jgi:DNA-binding SARP family transcriptional activator
LAVVDAGLSVGLLGPLRIVRDGSDIRLGSGKQRLVLAALAVAGRPVSTDELIDVLWVDDVPATAVGTLQTHVSRLRSQVGTDKVVGEDGFYRLVAGGGLDTRTFTEGVDAARAARDRGDRLEARRHFRAAAALWRGPALAEFRYEPFAQLEIARLEALRLEAEEDRCELEIDSGDSLVIPDLEQLVGENLYRERPTLLLMRALYRAGRHADALAVAQRLRTTLRDDLGVSASPELGELERRILQHDTTLVAPATDASQARWRSIVDRVAVPEVRPDRKCDLLVERADALRRAGRLNEAGAAAAAAVRLAISAGDDARLGVAALALAGPPEDVAIGEQRDTELLERSLTTLGADSLLAAMVRARLAMGVADSGDIERANEMFTAATALVASAGDPGAEAYVLRSRHRALFDPEALDERLTISLRLAELADATGNDSQRAWADRWLAIDLLESGDVDGADRVLDDLSTVAGRLHDAFHEWSLTIRRAGRRTATGPLDEADALMVEALEHATTIGSEYTMAATSGLFLALRWRQGRLAELDPLIPDLAARSPALGPLIPFFHAELGRHDDARSSLDSLCRDELEAVLGADTVGTVRLLALTALTEAAFQVDHRPAAAILLDRLNGIPSTLAVLHPGIAPLAPVDQLRAEALGCLGHVDDAIAAAERASRFCERTACHVMAARSNAVLSRLLRRRRAAGDAARATALDDEVRRLADSTGAVVNTRDP